MWWLWSEPAGITSCPHCDFLSSRQFSASFTETVMLFQSNMWSQTEELVELLLSSPGSHSLFTSCLVWWFFFSVPYRSRKPTAVTRCMCPLYDTNRQAWIELQPMSVARLGHGMVAAGQCRKRLSQQHEWYRKHTCDLCYILESLITQCSLSVRGFSVCDGWNWWTQHSPGQWREIWPRVQHLEPHTPNATGTSTPDVSAVKNSP